MKKKWIEHIVKEGARYHVCSYDTYGKHCSEPNCEINKNYEKRKKSKKKEKDLLAII